MMTFEQAYDLAAPIDAAWDVVSDVERVAPCLPGASLESVSGSDFTGRVTIKVGPIQIRYGGRGRVLERDQSTHTMAIEAKGQESSGTGTAAATVSARLEAGDDTGCRMHVSANFEVTGTPARFGSGAMSEVAGRIVQKFAANLSNVVSTESAVTTAEASTASLSAPPEAQTAGRVLTVLDLVPESWRRAVEYIASFVAGLGLALVGAKLLRRQSSIGQHAPFGTSDPPDVGSPRPTKN